MCVCRLAWPFRGQGEQRMMMCVSVCMHAPVPAFLTPALFGPLLISDLWSDFKLKNPMIGVDWE